MSTIISSSDPFFVYHPDVRVNPLMDDVFMSDDDVAYSASKRNSYIQAIPSFSHATDLTDAVKAMVCSLELIHQQIMQFKLI